MRNKIATMRNGTSDNTATPCTTPETLRIGRRRDIVASRFHCQPSSPVVVVIVDRHWLYSVVIAGRHHQFLSSPVVIAVLVTGR